MYSFQNDYSEGAHPNILKRLSDTNWEQLPGYGEDIFSAEAKKLIKKEINNQDALVYFVAGGTLANLLVISSLLKPHEAVISAKTGHIHEHEAGSIEAVGHKIITIDTHNGKLTPEKIENTLKDFKLRPHTVKPRMVYISNSTELGTIYKLKELEAIYNCCQSNNLLLYMDGARLSQAIASTKNDIRLLDLQRLTNVFYIGGTKNGALLGEAVVFNDPGLMPEFDYIIKQKGGLLAKGKAIGIQFLELFTNNLFYDMADHANRAAMKIADSIRESGHSFLTEPETNQIFPILPDKVIEELQKNYHFYVWSKIDEKHSAVRLITSWATPSDAVNQFISDLKEASKTS